MTLFPDIFAAYIGESMIKKAIDNGILEVYLYNIRDFSENKHKKVDDYPFGGGAGMVMTPQPIISTYEHIIKTHNINKPRVIYLSPKGYLTRRWPRTFHTLRTVSFCVATMRA